MKIRKDSPFHGITEEQIDEMLERSTQEPLYEVAEWWVHVSGKEIGMDQVRRFLSRVKRQRMLQDAEDANEDLEGFAERADNKKWRDGLIEAARQRLFEEALEKGDSKTLMELYRSANDERAREREVEVERRKAAATEERVKIGWKKLELQRAETALRLLPQLRVVLEGGEGSAEERLARARELVRVGGGRLLAEGNGRAFIGDGTDLTQGREEAEPQPKTSNDKIQGDK